MLNGNLLKTLPMMAIGFGLMSAFAAQAQAQAQQDRQLRVGVLECNVSGGIGLIVGSQKTMTCRFMPGNGRRQEVYVGRINRFGLDIGATTQSAIAWTVFAPTDRLSRGQLAGTYAGVGGEATVGVGLGANALIGGSNNTVALQPLSVQAQTGLNLAAGVTSLTLERRR
jgi:hypothetical protein